MLPPIEAARGDRVIRPRLQCHPLSGKWADFADIIPFSCRNGRRSASFEHAHHQPLERGDHRAADDGDDEAPPEARLLGDPADELVRAMATYRKDFEMRIYPGAAHAFFNDTRPRVYREAAARDAWERVLNFFRRTLLAA